MGSSMGAAVTLLYAARGDESIRSLILIAAPVDLRTLMLSGAGITDIRSLPEDGMTAIDGIPIKNTFFREIDRIDMTAAVSAIRVPVLAFHGGQDPVVDPRNAELLEELLVPFTKTVIIDDGDHNLTRDIDIRLMKETIIEWLTGDDAARRGTAEMIAYYLLVLGIILVLAGALEVSIPLRAFAFWKRWSSSRYLLSSRPAAHRRRLSPHPVPWPPLPDHFRDGTPGRPHRTVRAHLSGKIQDDVRHGREEMKDAGIKKMVYVEGLLRIAAGIICTAAFFLGGP